MDLRQVFFYVMHTTCIDPLVIRQGWKMTFPQQNNFSITVEKQNPANITKASFPLRYGTYSEIRTSDYEFRFNLSGEIKFIRGLNTNWPHPAEQLKRTDGNDWVYYSVGDQSGEDGLISWMGEYYLPCLPYPSNPVWEVNYVANPNIMHGFAAWSQLYADLYGAKENRQHPRARDLIIRILEHDDRVLHERSQHLHTIIGERVSVLPPDTRHVDYEIIPLMIADGCLYHCDFCCVKTLQRFRVRSDTDILDQIRRLKDFYGRNLENYNALFLGNHDALAAGADRIHWAVCEADNAFRLSDSRPTTPMLYFFASVDSFLRSTHQLFEKLNQLPFYTFINIGFESADPSTLAFIGKPVSAPKVREVFCKMNEINAAFTNIEITGNFLIGTTLSPDHYQALEELLGSAPTPPKGKGAIYLSPIKDSPKKRELLPQFLEIKQHSRLPVYIYLIQRL
ncbi:Radical SAM domain protein [Olavius algarvensis associated proteobacterium Delta 3]|nr:Radical SAM domain protein [Olavius algarvensis associated proteobacterium Delta 3]CAB5118488.1 Radical SAM domain protein [Olavius algarvensis associated proteobacterium Delta 3]